MYHCNPQMLSDMNSMYDLEFSHIFWCMLDFSFFNKCVGTNISNDYNKVTNLSTKHELPFTTH